ncbi:MAG TPA: hypothetical protein VFX16_08035 [Pseudonocardiaceae bacterium]|nr:hypothetical protein [Pseudonocardiaceae bacterium]
MTNSWPVADFDPVRRLQVIAATTPGASVHQTVLDVPLESVWAVAADLERELPRWLFPDIKSVRVTEGADDRLVMHVLGRSGLRARFDVVLRPGWCLMQSRFLLGGMAATEEHGRTRFAFLGAFLGPLRVTTPIARPLSRRNGTAALRRLTRRIEER